MITDVIRLDVLQSYSVPLALQVTVFNTVVVAEFNGVKISACLWSDSDMTANDKGDISLHC